MNKIEDNLEKNLEKINRPSRRNYIFSFIISLISNNKPIKYLNLLPKLSHILDDGVIKITDLSNLFLYFLKQI